MKKLFLVCNFIFTSSLLLCQWTHIESININWISEDDFENAFQTLEGDLIYTLKINSPLSGKLHTSISDIKTVDGTSLDHWAIDSKIVTEANQHFIYISFQPLLSKQLKTIRLKSATVKCEVQSKSNFRGPNYKSTSVLQSGTFYKITIPRSGAYAISGSMLSEAGIDITNIHPNNIKIWYGNSNQLNEKISEYRVDDLLQTPCIVTGSENGSFNIEDEIRFYANGPSSIEYLPVQNRYFLDKNPYSNVNYVYLQIDENTGERINTINGPEKSPVYSTDRYDYIQVYNDDKTNLLGRQSGTHGTGQIWYGDYFGLNTNIDFSDKFEWEGTDYNYPLLVDFEMAARSEFATNAILRINNQEFEANFSSTQTSNLVERKYAYTDRINENVIVDDHPSIEVMFKKKSSKDEAWLDYIHIESVRKVDVYGQQTIFFDKNSINKGVAEYHSPLKDNIQVWNISNLEKVYQVRKNNGAWTFNADSTLQRFIAIDEYYTPEIIGKVENQNIHNIAETDLVIVYDTIYENEVQRLSQFKRNFDLLNVVAIPTHQIYNEFSSGKLDPTAIRDFARMIHRRTSNFKYLLLFGDGSYDYRNIDPNLENHNFVPVYETKESLDPIHGYPSDDYFGLLSDDEGDALVGGLDISVGRLPVETIQEAKDVVNKIIRYSSGEFRFGSWRTNLSFVADDEDSNQHLDQSENISKRSKEIYSAFNQKKVYFDAFRQESTPGGERYYNASNNINNSIKSGLLVMNYLGHGGPSGWAQERVLKKSDIDTWDNTDHIPFLITATCTFTCYDDPNVVSAGEYAFRKKNGGVIGLFTTVRAVYATNNKRLVDAIFDNLLKLDEEGNGYRLGDIFLLGKNKLTGGSHSPSNARKFALIGDPSLRLAVPENNIVVTDIINSNTQETIDTIGALENVTIKGAVLNNDSILLSDFNGIVDVTLFDKQSEIQTLVNDPGSKKEEFSVFNKILFKGSSLVENGIFSISFSIPKDIKYNYGNGRISFYATNNIDKDAMGSTQDIIIGGTSSNFTEDNVGPVIKGYINNTQFLSGDKVSRNSTLLVFFEDDTGINASGNSIGHDITATVDDQKVYVLNNNYNTKLNDPTSGSLRFPLTDLELGMHTVKIKAWDLSNNSASTTISFEIVDELSDDEINPIIYPNPLADQSFSLVFQSDLLHIETDIDIIFYDELGRKLGEIHKVIVPDGNKMLVEITEGENILRNFPTGLYFYKIILTYNELNTMKQSEYKKIIKF